MTGIKPSRWDKVYKDFQGDRFSVWKEFATPFFTDKIQFLKNSPNLSPPRPLSKQDRNVLFI
ncbi:MAG: hypothetical protein Q8P68_05955 [Candidatus Peregrinibacteria bacterium]|nr:hypothetical protein [Candidatus Peregrinibacteria bacterium]MDZ4244947.1 hypothetical protein [Candidatus Gracilibacteria bacterium]